MDNISLCMKITFWMDCLNENIYCLFNFWISQIQLFNSPNSLWYALLIPAHELSVRYWYSKHVARRTKINLTESKEQCKHYKWPKHSNFTKWNTFDERCEMTNRRTSTNVCMKVICPAAFVSFYASTDVQYQYSCQQFM